MKNIFKNRLLLIIVLAILSRLLLLGGSLLVNNNLVENWVHFDGEWYIDIAKNGYDSEYPSVTPENLLCNEGTGFCQRNFAFFPLYPMTMNVVHEISGLSIELSGILISNIAFVLAVLVLFKFTKQVFSQKIAVISSILLIVFPIGYVFSAVMSESLFLLLLLLTLYFAFNNKYVLAGVSGLVLTATRNIGVLVLIPLIFLYWQQNKKEILLKQINWKIIVCMLMVPAGLIFFGLYLNLRVNDFLAFIHIQAYWEKPVLGLNPIFAIPFSIFDYRLEGSFRNHLYNLTWFAGIVILFFFSSKKKLLPAFLNNIFLWFIIPLTAGSMLALPRYICIQFPIYISFAKLLVKNKIILYITITICFLALLLLTLLYIKGFWITV